MWSYYAHVMFFFWFTSKTALTRAVEGIFSKDAYFFTVAFISCIRNKCKYFKSYIMDSVILLYTIKNCCIVKLYLHTKYFFISFLKETILTIYWFNIDMKYWKEIWQKVLVCLRIQIWCYIDNKCIVNINQIKLTSLQYWHFTINPIFVTCYHFITIMCNIKPIFRWQWTR